MPHNLTGLTVAITGAANGIGLAAARSFTKAGAKVAIGDIDSDGAERAASTLDGPAMGLGLDVSDREGFAAFVDTVEERLGPLDVLVNNAGVDWIGPFHEEPDEVTRREIDINLMGTITGTRLALQRMLPRGRGHIVNVASGVGRVPLPGSASYAASKHGIVGLTESLRLEYRKTPIRFSLIQPSQVRTAMLEGQAQPKLMAQIPPEEVGEAIVGAVRNERFEVWVPGSQAISFKLGSLLPRRARERVLLAMGLARLAEGTDGGARRGYHERMFGDV